MIKINRFFNESNGRNQNDYLELVKCTWLENITIPLIELNETMMKWINAVVRARLAQYLSLSGKIT